MIKHIVLLTTVILIVSVGISACSPSQIASTLENTETPRSPDTQIPTEIPSSTPSPTATVSAEIIFYNGNLITMEQSRPLAQALAIRGDLILAVGSDEEVLPLQNEDTILVDLQGLTLMPGFIDGHNHMLTFYDRMGKTLEDAQEAALQHGFTTMSEMWANDDVVNDFLQREQAGELRLRVNLFPSYNDGILGEDRRKILLESWYPEHDPILDPERMLRIPGIKIFVDGDNAKYERGCWALSEPFETGAGVLSRGICGTPRGDLYWEQDELNQVVRSAQEAGYRVVFHAMGDLAIETALNAIEYSLNGQSNETYRHQIDHNSMIRPDLLPRYQALSVAATVRGHIELCNLTGGELTFGSERNDWYANRYVLPTLGIHTFIETDFGWLIDPEMRYDQRTLDPFMHLYGYVTHYYASAENQSCAPDPQVADTTISVQRALEMMTIEPAWAISMENYLGSLEVGKYADLIVLSGDPLTIDPQDLKDLRVWMTLVNGKVEYCADGHEEMCQGKLTVAAIADLPATGNLALNQPVRASSDMQYPPELAVDGDETTAWGAGDFAPQWIEVDLGAPASIGEIRLLVGQSPDGDTMHRILAGRTRDDLSEIHKFNEPTRDLDWLIFTLESPLEGVQFVRVETLESPSWVAWLEIQVFGTR